MKNSLNLLVRQLHERPQRIVVEVAGAGTQLITWLHSVSGSSRTVIEATDRYSRNSLVSLIKQNPDNYVTADVAVSMSEAALRRANLLTNSTSPVLGVSCTAAISTDRLRKGENRAFISISGGMGTAVMKIGLMKSSLTRQQQEEIVSTILLQELAKFCGVLIKIRSDYKEILSDFEFRPKKSLRFQEGKEESILMDPSGIIYDSTQKLTKKLVSRIDWKKFAIMPGAFNPLHKGHRFMAEAAKDFLGRELLFELSLVNADKAALSIYEAQARLAQFVGYSGVLLTNVPLFSSKAKLFPGAVFVIGIDTLERILDKKFYNGSYGTLKQSLQMIFNLDCKFLVAGRRMGKHYRTLSDLTISLPSDISSIFQELPESLFRVDLSSTEIRSGVS